jgi:hypothetical protein
MNGSELSKTVLGDVQAMLAHDEAGTDRRELERWATTIAGCLQQAVPVRPQTLGLGELESSQEVPAGWRPRVETLTPGVAAGPMDGPASGAPSAETTEDQRIQVRVTTEEFGEIALVVERVETGLRVLLGAVDPRAVTVLARESQAVRRALESDGQNVGSLEIVRMDGLGTDLAQSKVAPSNRARRHQESPESDAGLSQRKRKAKRLDVTG